MVSHEIQFDGQEDLTSKLEEFAEVITKIGADLPPGDFVEARIILAADDDLVVGVRAGLPKEDALFCLNTALEEREKALAAVRPPVVVASVDEPDEQVPALEAKPAVELNTETPEALVVEEEPKAKKGAKK